MTTLSLSVVALIAIIAAMFASSLVASAQSAARFEYNRVTPYGRMHTEGRIGNIRIGYRACLAATDGWTCSDFEPQASDAAFRTALATLGNEGWELVSVSADPSPSPYGLTYLFKRQRQ